MSNNYRRHLSSNKHISACKDKQTCYKCLKQFKNKSGNVTHVKTCSIDLCPKKFTNVLPCSKVLSSLVCKIQDLIPHANAIKRKVIHQMEIKPDVDIMDFIYEFDNKVSTHFNDLPLDEKTMNDIITKVLLSDTKRVVVIHQHDGLDGELINILYKYGNDMHDFRVLTKLIKKSNSFKLGRIVLNDDHRLRGILPEIYDQYWMKLKHCAVDTINEFNNILKTSSLCKLCKINPTREDYCSPCFYFSFPENAKTRQHKTKENTFMFNLKKIYPNLILDKTVAGGCSRRRPDGLLDLLTHSIIVEIDEDQHRSYNSTCELARLNELFTDLGDRPIIFLRLNPDSYYSNGEFVHGCFKKDMTLVIKEFDRRLKLLIAKLEECFSVPESHVTEVRLFFDC